MKELKNTEKKVQKENNQEKRPLRRTVRRTSAAAVPEKKAAAKPATRQYHRTSKKNMLRIIPLGGLDEIGKNMTAFEIGGEIILVDCGMAFPDDAMPCYKRYFLS